MNDVCTVEVSLSGFIETMEALRDALFVYGDAAWNLLIEQVKDGDTVDLSVGPSAVITGFFRDAYVVERADYARMYPRYSRFFTWDEFVCNECRFGNDEVALLDREE